MTFIITLIAGYIVIMLIAIGSLFAGAEPQRKYLWALVIPLTRTKHITLACILNSDAWPKTGSWNATLWYRDRVWRHYEGRYRRFGRWLVAWSWPKRRRRHSLKPVTSH